ncbi:MAG TPA: ATP-binding protein [Thermoanaerobaculia bacterium]|nr:ATP-binding protein [Thermoanaerobaculia bacterium]
MPALARQLRWYIAIRVVAIGSVLLPYILLQLLASSTPPQVVSPGEMAPNGAAPEMVGPPLPPTQAAEPVAAPSPAPLAPETLRPEVVYSLGGLTFLATLLYISLLRLLRRHLTIQAYIQFFGDLLLITALVYLLGGIASPFSMLYLIVIAVASAMLRRRAGLTVASAAYVLYAVLILGLFFGWLPQPTPPTLPVSLWRLFYNLAVHGFGFYAVALLTSYLAHNVTRVERELEEKSDDLADLQVAYRDVIQSINSGLITTDLAGSITSVNQAGLALLGQQEADLVGRSIQTSGLFTLEYWRELTTAASGRTGGRLRSEAELLRGGEAHYVGFSISQLSDADGLLKGYIVIFQDLTRYRRLQEELRLKDRMAAVGELAAGLAHEIGNPLAAISGSVQMLSSKLEGDASQRKLIDILLKESQRLDRTIKGFLRFARPRERSSVSFDIARLLAENFELLKNSQEVSDHHRLEVDLDPPSLFLIADPDQISQIFWNLARNALRAMPDGGTLKVIGGLGQEFYRFDVIDTGRGMSEEQRANLFHPFHSLFDGGTGIGMAIVYRIVQDHGGRLRVDSRPGGGTTITVELPVDTRAVLDATLSVTQEVVG